MPLDKNIKPIKMPIIVSSDEARKKFEENLKRLQTLEANLMNMPQDMNNKENQAKWLK